MKKKFSMAHLKKLAANGKGGLAVWAKKQLSGGVRAVAPATKQKRVVVMAKRHGGLRRSGGSGGMGVAINSVAGGAAYAVANNSFPALAQMSPILRLAVGAYLATNTSGMLKTFGSAILVIEGAKFGSSINIGGVLGSSNGATAQGVFL